MLACVFIMNSATLSRSLTGMALAMMIDRWDLINACFEIFGGLIAWLNVRVLLRDKEVRGVAISPTAVFTTWGVWNLAYYPHLHQNISVIGAGIVTLANATWVAMAWWYRYGRGMLLMDEL